MKQSSAVYMIETQSIRDQGCYKMLRTRKNAYRSHKDYRDLSDEERGQVWDNLKEAIEAEGFDPERPITIQLLRKDGERDQIKDGHHRFGIAVALKKKHIPVRFLFEN